ncbi:MAG: hypothetical protein JSV88_16740 [Candidatus Aminicenantes bacterium]|nr:MAG: hypothetical protein JSV88_16740 [Candidatus Aminicenantes bacterium]
MAINYTLDLIIDDDSLAIIRAAQLKLTLAKPVGGGNPNVTWLVFSPFAGNKVEWQEEFGIYASPNQVIQNGAVISRISEVFPAQDAAYYSFSSSATFGGPFTGSGAPGKGQFKVNNDMPNTTHPALTFGLEQKASINASGIEASPINAALIPAAMKVTFTPLTTVYVWLQGQFTSGTVITEINGDATSVTFGGSITSQALVYDPATGRFVPSSADGKMIPWAKVSHVLAHQRAGVFYLSNK